MLGDYVPHNSLIQTVNYSHPWTEVNPSLFYTTLINESQ